MQPAECQATATPSIEMAVILGFLDGIIHYHIDWVKTNLARDYTTKDKEFWILHGADQGLHYLTYIGIIAILVLL